MADQIVTKVFKLEEQVEKLTELVKHLEQKIEYNAAVHRNHLIRVKNGELLDDNVITEGRPYSDLSPISAHEIINDPNSDYLVLDVSKDDYENKINFESSVRIPLEELNTRFEELPSSSTSILVISENGLRSIKGCEILAEQGFFNINNISGGYEHWPR